MADNGQSNPTVVRTSRGLTVGGTRLTIYQLMDHFKAGHSDEQLQDWYGLSVEELADIHRYVAEHRVEVEAEYQHVLLLAEQNRRYWEARNKDRMEQIERLPKSPLQEKVRDKVLELKRKLNLP